MLHYLHLVLASFVLLGSAGVTVSRHFCQAELKSVAVFGEARQCHQDQRKVHCPLHAPEDGEETPERRGCCDDEQELFQIDDQRTSEQKLLPPAPAVVAPAPPAPPVAAPPPVVRLRKQGGLENYRPPPKLFDAPRDFQIFRL